MLGVVLNDGTSLKSVEVKVDDGPWQPATMDSATREKYSWKLFSYAWNGATPGDHTLVSRVTDSRGNVQVVEALVPLANMFGYVNQLRSFSQRRAQYTMPLSHYEEVPQNVADEVKAKLA